MILSYRHQFIFLHARKTAGSSMSVELARQFGDEDIMVGCWADALRSGVSPNRAALRAAREAPSRRWVDRLLRLRRPGPDLFNRQVKEYFEAHHELDAAAHSSAECVRSMDPDLWRQAFKFVFVRNPWDHAVSDYLWRRGREKGVSFKDFLLRVSDVSIPDPEGVRPPIRSNWSVYTIADEVVADYVGRYESIDADLANISKEVGLDIDIHGTKAKSGPGARDVRSFYDSESVDLVGQIYRHEIAAFDYSMPF